MRQKEGQGFLKAQRKKIDESGFHLLGELALAPVAHFLGGDARRAIYFHIHPAFVLAHDEGAQVAGGVCTGQHVLMALQQDVDAVAEEASVQRYGDHAQFALAHQLKTLRRGGHHIQMGCAAADLIYVAAFIAHRGIREFGFKVRRRQGCHDQGTGMRQVLLVLHDIRPSLNGGAP